MNKVCVYGTLKSNEGASSLMGISKFLGHVLTPPMFSMVGRGFPKIFLTERGGQVRGELYEVSDETLEVLDRYEGYPTFYNRMEIPVRFIDHPDVEAETAWIYYIPGEVEHTDLLWLPKDGVLTWSRR